ncbi:hypothetical protein BC828DRAFT_383488 [Blastocladiella britannica]|nr:hypothetical protein BC828DRAFT_383488 [Blastocladiella britannica]
METTRLHIRRHTSSADACVVPDVLYHQIDILHSHPLPAAASSTAVQALSYVKVAASLAFFVSEAFLALLGAHASKSNVAAVALSVDPKSCTAAELRRSVLHLLLPKDTYQSFGLTGSHVRTKQGSRYAVQLPLASGTSERVLNRARWCFAHTLTGEFDLAFTGPPEFLAALQALAGTASAKTCPFALSTWTAPSATVVPPLTPLLERMDSAAAASTTKRTAVSSSTKKSMGPVACVPKARTALSDETRECVLDHLEWVGLAAMQADRVFDGKAAVDPIISTYRAPVLGDDDGTPVSMTKTSFRGLMDANRVTAILDAVRGKDTLSQRDGAAKGRKRASPSDDERAARPLMPTDVMVIARVVPSQIHDTSAGDCMWLLPGGSVATGFVGVQLECSAW